MIFFLLFLCAVALVNAQIFPQGKFNKEYLSKADTKCIKGFFSIMVLFSHYAQYAALDTVWDAPYVALRGHLDQMIVVPFLFYSGYGIMKSIQKKGKIYVKNIIRKRFPKVWFNFCVAVMCFWAVDIAFGKVHSLKEVLLAFTGWESIGNSNWYIMGILILYILTYFAFHFISSGKGEIIEIAGCTLLTLFTVTVVRIFMEVGKPDYYYNTLIIYCIGCWFAVFQQKIESLLLKNDFIYLLIFTIVVCGYCWSFSKRWDYGIKGYTVWAIAFTAVLLMITMKVSFKSQILSWYGDHVFSIYILQRIPIRVLYRMGVSENHKYMHLIMSFLITTVLAIVFERVVGELYTFLEKSVRKNKRMEIDK